ncbi:MAG: hypothetical protein OHK0019_31950 [Saprospiraceae bacterium]
MRTFLFLLMLVTPRFFLAQTSSTDSKAASLTPIYINASDGVYEKFVLIRWEAVDKMGDYRVFRATSSSGASLQELTKNWQKSTWFCDYSAERGRDYFYAVMGSDGKTSSPLSRFDKGFVRKDDKSAYDDSFSSVTSDRYAASKQIFVLVAEVDTDTTAYAAGNKVQLRIGLQNIFNEPTPRTELRVYLSSDAIWDFNDTLLTSKTYSGFPAELKVTLEEQITLPQNVLPGQYHLLVVAAPEGNILNAKTGSTFTNIYGQ